MGEAKNSFICLIKGREPSLAARPTAEEQEDD